MDVVGFQSLYELHQIRFQETPEADRIGATHAVVGLYNLANTLHSDMDSLCKRHDSRFVALEPTLEEIRSSTITLESLKLQLHRPDIPHNRAVLISIDQVVMLLTNAIILFDDLHNHVLKVVSSNSSLLEKGWNDILRIFVELQKRLQWQNMKWNMQLSLLTWYAPISLAITVNTTNIRRIARVMRKQEK